MIFILIEPVIRLFATTRCRSLSFLWVTLIFLLGCQSEHQKSLQDSNQIRSSTNSYMIAKKALRKKSHSNTAFGAHNKKKKNLTSNAKNCYPDFHSIDQFFKLFSATLD